MGEIRDYFLSLMPRERFLLGGGLVIGVITLVFVVFVEPFWDTLAQKRTYLQERIQEYEWLQSVVAEIQPRLQELNTPEDPETNVINVKLSAIEKSVRDSGLQEQLIRLAAGDDGTLEVSLEAVSYERLIEWLRKIEQEFRRMAGEITMQATTTPGHIDVQLTLIPLQQ